LLCACICLPVALPLAHADHHVKPAAAAQAAAPQPAPDAKTMEAMMMKAAMPGPQHEKLKKLVGEWNLTVKATMDPTQPAQESKSSAVVTELMDGRYVQEQVSGDMGGMAFRGMGVTGFDNILQKYVSIWIDNMGTGIMMSEGTANAAGDVIRWTGEASDPMSGKKTKYRLVSRFVDDNKRVFEMYAKGPDGKESQMMEITYERKM
jgi:hypothetical protein